MKKKEQKKNRRFIGILVSLILVAMVTTGCFLTAPVEPTAQAIDQVNTDVAATVEAVLESTAEVQPTSTTAPASTSTVVPTETPLSMPTDLPTATALPTATPTTAPTATPLPTNTPVVIYVTPVYTATPSVGVLLSTTSVGSGESFTVTVYGFSANVDIDFKLREVGASTSLVADGKTDSTGTAAVQLTMPNAAVSGESWEVFVTTTEIYPAKTATSKAITIKGTATSTGVSKVLLSSTSLAPGDTFTVSVTGFPALQNIDFKLGESGESVSVIADGKTDSSGSAAVLMTIPSGAVKGEKWIVTVVTTDLTTQVKKTSDTITITD